jgi:hypothetical protein
MTDASPAISGYRYGQVGRSPVTLEELHRLEATVGFTRQDRDTLTALRGILTENAEALVNDWREIIALLAGVHTSRTRVHSNLAASERVIRAGSGARSVCLDEGGLPDNYALEPPLHEG